MAKWATFFHQPLSTNGTSLKKAGLKFGSGCVLFEALEDMIDRGIGEVMPDDVPRSEKLGVPSRLREPDAFCEANDPESSCSLPGGSGAFLKRLAIPDLMMPGWRPSRGASREIVPRIRCFKVPPYTGLGDG